MTTIWKKRKSASQKKGGQRNTMAPKTFLVLFPFFPLSHLFTGVYYPLQVVDLVVLPAYFFFSISVSFSYCGSDLIGHHFTRRFEGSISWSCGDGVWWGKISMLIQLRVEWGFLGGKKIFSYFSRRCLPEEELAVYSADLFICFLRWMTLFIGARAWEISLWKNSLSVWPILFFFSFSFYFLVLVFKFGAVTVLYLP